MSATLRDGVDGSSVQRTTEILTIREPCQTVTGVPIIEGARYVSSDILRRVLQLGTVGLSVPSTRGVNGVEGSTWGPGTKITESTSILMKRRSGVGAESTWDHGYHVDLCR